MKPDCVRARVRSDLVADDAARARDHREDARRQPGVDDALGELHGADSGRGRRRPDDRIARRERRCDDLGGHRVGPVPRRDDADHAAGYAVGEHPLRGVDRRRHRARQTSRISCGHAPVDDQLLDLAVRLGVQRLALVEGEHPRELVAPLLDQVRDALHRCRALESRARRPGAPRRIRRGDRLLRVLARAFGQRAETLPCRRARRLEARAGLRLCPRSADDHRVVASRDAHARPWPVAAPAGRSPAPPPRDDTRGTVLSGPVPDVLCPPAPRRECRPRNARFIASPSRTRCDRSPRRPRRRPPARCRSSAGPRMRSGRASGSPPRRSRAPASSGCPRRR